MGSRTGYTDDRQQAQAGAHPKSILRDYTETILICVIFVVFSRTFIFQQSKIPSGSMKDTLLVGDYIMVNRFIYAPTSFDWERHLLPGREIQRGDVVVFKQPDKPEIDYIKRVIGLPGDTVELRQGHVYVNDELQEEPYVKEAYRLQDRLDRKNYGPEYVDADHYFVLGDHRNASEDSRAWGQVPRGLMKGRALLIWWSYEEDRRHASRLTLTQQLRSWGSKARHFFTKSRWSRCFSLIR